MPNPHNRDLKQSVLNFGTKVQATTPSLSSASSGPARSAVASGALRFTPYEAAAAKTPPATAKKFRTPTMLRPCAVARQAQANGMGLKKSDSGSKIVIDLTSGTAAAASRATAGGGWSSTPRAAAPPRSNGWSNPSPSTTTIPTLSRAPTTTMSSTTAAAVRRAAAHSNNGNINGNTTMGALARSAGLEEGFGSNERYRPKHREVFMDDLLSENQPQSGGRHTKALNMDGTRGAFKPVKEKIFLLSGEQEMVSQLVVEKRESLFFTGSAGTGKSVLLRELITRLQCKYSRDEIGVTASTGIAACNIGGTTLHSFAGCGLGKEPAEALARRCVGNKKTCTRWRKCKVLIIDEISMVEGEFFDKLDKIGQIVRNVQLPFGGIQLVICGDFMQLPPVARASKFAFEAQSWAKAVKRTIQLTHVFRQKDQTFINLLNEMRVGFISPQSENLLRSLSRPVDCKDGLEPTQLYAIRTQVDEANHTRLRSLHGETRTFNATDMCKSENDRNKLKDFMAPLVLTLKVGAQVMLLKNLDEKLVNGSLGKVAGFEPESGLPIVEFIVAGRPKLMEMATETWSVEAPGIGTVASRTQVPLVLAYSMSIHKSQGQTLEKVKVDLGKVFENGQAYVALSRATSLEGLQVLNYSKDKVKVDPRVIRFNQNLSHMKPSSTGTS